ncbi:hypothetical protein DVH24_012777 [Malus domestica]|uniref:Uncharacterized protein n=1 Tax=Malus domestica TaxID=3750 RepID=A0A498HW13_MALDO|nr:hypothetical protein DVH24_012777 [Malus domestica]
MRNRAKQKKPIAITKSNPKNQFCCHKGNSGSEARLGIVNRPTTRPGTADDDGVEELECFLRVKLGEPEDATAMFFCTAGTATVTCINRIGSEARLGIVNRPTTQPGMADDDGVEEFECFLRIKLGEPEYATALLL